MNDQFRPSQGGNSDPPRIPAVKYLAIMFWLGLATLIVTLITWLPIQDGWAAWVKRAFNVGTILCLFLLTPANLHYRKSAYFRTVMFCCSILSLFIHYLSHASLLISLLSFVLSIAACWQLYRAHAELISGHNEKMARNWRCLFWWELALSAIASIISVASYILVPTAVLPFDAIAVFTAISSWIMVILNTILTVISLVFLGLTVNILKR